MKTLLQLRASAEVQIFSHFEYRFNFFDVSDVFGSKFSPFLHSARKLKVKLAFKARIVVFRERNFGNWESAHFLSFWSENAPARWNPLFMVFLRFV